MDKRLNGQNEIDTLQPNRRGMKIGQNWREMCDREKEIVWDSPNHCNHSRKEPHTKKKHHFGSKAGFVQFREPSPLTKWTQWVHSVWMEAANELFHGVNEKIRWDMNSTQHTAQEKKQWNCPDVTRNYSSSETMMKRNFYDCYNYSKSMKSFGKVLYRARAFNDDD